MNHASVDGAKIQCLCGVVEDSQLHPLKAFSQSSARIMPGSSVSSRYRPASAFLGAWLLL